jgi:hypothetical protein
MEKYTGPEFNKVNLTDGENEIDKKIAILEIELHNAKSEEEKDKIRDERGKLIFERSKKLQNAKLN